MCQLFHESVLAERRGIMVYVFFNPFNQSVLDMDDFVRLVRYSTFMSDDNNCQPLVFMQFFQNIHHFHGCFAVQGSGTLGKAFGGAMGGFTTGRKEIIDMLRQRSRPYLFSNSVAPAIVGASLEMFKMLKESDALHTKLMDNVTYFRDKMLAAGFDIKPTQSAICAVMLYDAKLSQDFAAKMQEEGIYVTGFYYPVVPKGQARIRVQLSAGHEREHLDKAIAAFIKVGKELGVIK